MNMWKKKYSQALPLASLDRVNGGNYVIQNADCPSTHRNVISLIDGGNRLGVEAWDNNFSSDKMFKVQPCSDHSADWIISAYGSEDKQWIVEYGELDKPATLNLMAYPNRNDEKLRPSSMQWRFTFEDVHSFGSKKYRIVSNDPDLDDNGMNYLQFGGPNEK